MKYSYSITIALAIVTLNACDNAPISIPALPNMIPIPTPRVDNSTLPTGAEVQRANDLLKRGQRREAAKAYFNAAQKYRSPDRERLTLQAAELAVQISDRGLAQTYISALNNSRLNNENTARYRYIQGQMALADASYSEALRLLPKKVSGLPNGLARKILNARMRAAQSSGNHALLATELVLQEPSLKQAHKIKLNHQRIWSQIKLLSTAELKTARTQVTHPIMRGWLDLNFLERISANDPQQLNRNIAKWQRNFPRHPANAKAAKMISKAVVTPYTPSKPVPVTPVPAPSKPVINTSATPPLPSSLKRVAVILPLSGSLSSIGQSLLSGIKKAQKDYATNVEVKTYDSNSGNINAVYRKAISGGVDFVIGPFSKPKIAELSRVSFLPVNTLSLNYMAQGKAPTGLYQFGLLPEDEAAQAARQALQDGHKKIAIVAPDSSWGRRLRDTFGNVYSRGGGKVSITVNYANRNGGYADIAKGLMRKKGDFDAIFLAASPTQARGIQPAIHKGALKEMPVYATSHVYSGLANPYKNINLEGISYTEIPWILEVHKQGLPQESQFPRLRALGMDALMVAKGMRQLKGGAALNGRTGRIQVISDGTLHRQLKWAKFNGGSPIPLSN